MYVLKHHYQIEYAFFFNYSTTSNHALKHPISDRLIRQSTSRIFRHRRGAWLSSSSTATLGHYAFGALTWMGIIWCFNEPCHSNGIVEEHFISKLHFSWPQTTCGSECPTRGSEVVFASYKDSMGQIQKFALRFVRSSDSKLFVDALKVILQHVKTIGAPSSKFQAGVKSETQCITLDGEHQRAAVELDAMYPAVNDNQLQSPSSNGAQYHITSTGNGFSSSRGNLPSSFTAFLADCSTESQEGGTDQLKVPIEAEMLSYLTEKHMPDSSFHVMLSKMEKFISEMGGDLGLQIS